MKENDHFFHSKACTCRTCASWSSSCCCCRAASSWRSPFLAAGAAVFIDGCILAPSAPFVKAYFSYFFILMQIFSRSPPGIILQKKTVFFDFHPSDKGFLLSQVHKIFTDSFLPECGIYGMINTNGRDCVSARQPGQVRYRFDERNG